MLSITKSNAQLRVTWDLQNGGLSSIVLTDDPDGMNWIEGTRTWGEVKVYSKFTGHGLVWNYYAEPFMTFAGLEDRDGAVVSHYTATGLALTVTRRVEDDGLYEAYAFRNTSDAPIYFLRGHVGILATFNDSYGPAHECETQRCDTHIHAHGENAFVHAMKMGPFPTDLVLEMREGALDGYSVRISKDGWSNDRGDFVLHPAPFSLLAGETKVFSWRVRPVAAGAFKPPVRVRFETCFPGEEFEIQDAAGEHRVKAESVGELQALGARLYVSPPFGDLVEKRIRYIVEKQQCRDAKSPLYGAFLVYDGDDDRPFFDNRWGDHTASQERFGMGLLLARWLQTHHDPTIRAALDRFVAFVLREIVDAETGAVYHTLGHIPKTNRRLYNIPWAVDLFAEVSRLRGDDALFPVMEKAILDFYANGGAKFYPNACTFAETIAMMRDAGHDVSSLLTAHKAHIENLLANGVNYPPHEVKFEQTIVSPAVELLANYWLHIDHDPRVRAALDEHISVLVRFDGDQPDHVSSGVPIRHWDGYWFGKEHTYGDTLHYWGVLSGTSYLLYAKVTGDDRWLERARKCFRNLLFLYRPDGFATCAHYIPYAMSLTDERGEDIRTVRGERPDPWANDQDFGLYFMLRSGLSL